jgi:hypothetical protein
MMTRETKAGLLVSCSFLCLVGIVVFSKMTEQSAPEANNEDGEGWVRDPESPEAAGGKQATPLVEKENDNLRPKEPGKLVLASGQDLGGSSPAPTPKGAGDQADQTAAQRKPPSPAGAAAAPDLGPQIALDGQTKSDPPKKSEKPANGGVVVAPIIDFPMKPDPKATVGTGSKPTTTKDPSTPGIALGKDGWPQDKPASKPLIQVPEPPPAAPTVTSTQGTPSAAPKKNWWEEQPAKKEAKADNAPPKIDWPSDANAKNTATQPRTTVTPSGPSPTLNSDGSNTVNLPAAPSAIKNDESTKWPRTVAQDKPDRSALGSDSLNSTNDQFKPSAPTMPPAPVVNNNATPWPDRTAPASTPPAYGTPVAAATVPIRVAATPAAQPLVGNAAEVESYDEETYICRPNETFRSISQSYFQSDRYDRALQLFNRNHPLANDVMKSATPVLQAGQPVYIPPSRILDKYYSASISDSQPPTAQPAFNAPLAVSPQVSDSASAAVRIDTPRTYRVAAGGEMIRDIARRTLGDPERWTEIYRLNLSVDPKEAVAAGTELQLPAGARFDLSSPQ